MTHFSTILSTVALLLACIASMRYRQLHWTVTLALFTQLFAGVTHACVLQRMAYDAESYGRWFFASLAPALLASLVCAVKFSLPSGGWSTVLSTWNWLGVSMATVIMLGGSLRAIHWIEAGKLLVCAVWLFCAGVTLLSLPYASEGLQTVARIAFGGWWLAISLHGFLTVIAEANKQPQIVWVAKQLWAPGFLCFVVFMWFAFQLAGGQWEGARLLDAGSEEHAMRITQEAVRN